MRQRQWLRLSESKNTSLAFPSLLYQTCSARKVKEDRKTDVDYCQTEESRLACIVFCQFRINVVFDHLAHFICKIRSDQGKTKKRGVVAAVVSVMDLTCCNH